MTDGVTYSQLTITARNTRSPERVDLLEEPMARAAVGEGGFQAVQRVRHGGSGYERL